jgi:hypothetical protein
MIDSVTGEIQLPLGGVRVGPSLTREWLLASRVVKDCKELVRNEPYCSYELPKVQFEGHTFVWSLWFEGSVLKRVSICCGDAKFGSSWEEWSETKELDRKRLHDEVLASVLGPNWREERYSWGKIYSDYDPKGGFSSIEVTYKN